MSQDSYDFCGICFDESCTEYITVCDNNHKCCLNCCGFVKRVGKCYDCKQPLLTNFVNLQETWPRRILTQIRISFTDCLMIVIEPILPTILNALTIEPIELSEEGINNCKRMFKNCTFITKPIKINEKYLRYWEQNLPKHLIMKPVKINEAAIKRFNQRLKKITDDTLIDPLGNV